MSTQRADIATAFATHEFPDAAPHLAGDVRWNLVGGSTLTGKAAVTAAYEQTLTELASTTTRFRDLRVIEAQNAVVVQSVGEYRDPGGTVSVVASCDIVDFTGDLVTAITSYTVELSDGSRS